MRYSDESCDLRIELDIKPFELSPEDVRRLPASISLVGKRLEDPLVSELCITLPSPCAHEYQVKAVPVLPVKRLFSRDTDASSKEGFHRCVTYLVQQARDRRRGATGVPERRRGKQPAASERSVRTLAGEPD
jgi:hypothetical protein